MSQEYFLVIPFMSGDIWVYNEHMAKKEPKISGAPEAGGGEAVACFAGGCFWCVESDYEKLPEVKEVISGYMGGKVKNPSYEQVSSGETGHREAAKIVYDPNKTTYRDLVLHLLRHIDPTDSGGSFSDRGQQYTSAIYYKNDEEKKIAEEVIKELEEKKVFKSPIVTSVEPAGEFWLAEEDHQDYYKKNPLKYKHYRRGSGRDTFIEDTWKDAGSEAGENKLQNFKKPSEKELKDSLTPIQYEVTQKEGTERPFDNEYWDNHREGIYVDVVSGEPLFSSTDKFDSGTGWPSFLKPIDSGLVTERQDYKLLVPRTEIRSKYADSHLGHIIMDGPIENDKVRYCMNSAALRFVPKEDLEKEGLSDLVYLFDE